MGRRLFGGKRLRWHSYLPADGLGDESEGHSFFSYRVEGFILGTSLDGKAKYACGIQPMHGRPEVVSAPNIGGDSFRARQGS